MNSKSFQVNYSNKISATASYPFAEIDKKVQELKNKGVKVIDFGVGDPKSSTPDFVIQELFESAKRNATTGYPSYIGHKSFRQTCSDYMKREFNVNLDPETEISSTAGAKEAVFHFPISFINEGDIVICPTPGYPVYATGTKFAGGQVYSVPLLEENDFLIDFHSIPEDIAKKAKIIWTNYPNSPTGKSAPIHWLKKFVNWANKYNIIIAADEGCYIDIYFDKKPHSILEIQKEGIITFYSLSKRNNMTGYRSGFVAGDSRIVDGFKKIKTNVDSGTPNFIQDASSIALKDTKHADAMRKSYKEKYDILSEAFASKNLPACKSEATFYIWQKAPKNMTGLELAQRLVDIGIVVTPGAFISKTCNGINPGENYIRIALVANKEEIIDAANRIKNELSLSLT